MSYKDKLIIALGESILILVKYSLVIAAIIYAINYTNNTHDLALNGNKAINEYIRKGWLPPLMNGSARPNVNSKNQ